MRTTTEIFGTVVTDEVVLDDEGVATSITAPDLSDVDLELAFTERWERTEWFAKDAWLRLKMDVLERKPKDIVEVVDWKTGKVREGAQEYHDQLDIYELGAIVAGFGTAAQGRLVFTDHNVVVGEDRPGLTTEGVEAAKGYWEARVRPMFTERLSGPLS